MRQEMFSLPDDRLWLGLQSELKLSLIPTACAAARKLHSAGYQGTARGCWRTHMMFPEVPTPRAVHVGGTSAMVLARGSTTLSVYPRPVLAVRGRETCSGQLTR